MVSVVPLFWCNNENPSIWEFKCGGCEEGTFSTSYYACLECEGNFHKECVESPIEIIHPSHPFHSLGLSTGPFYMSYACFTCDFFMGPVFAMKSIPFVIDHSKSHPHSLTFFPTQVSLVCHICGLIDNHDPTYICIECVFVIHEGCIGFPHVIRISRHHHRISFTPSLPRENLSCRVCHVQIDNKYGAYSCSKGEAYFVHSNCALNRIVWDGKDLDGVPEEDDMIDDGEPFERIADGIIRHLFHSHNLRLDTSRAYDENKYCRGCGLPIYEGQFYSCMDMKCDGFILHESCANAPRMKRHPLHPHPLTLNVPGNNQGVFKCCACSRTGTSFFYEHHEGLDTFQLDLRCASITEPFQYQDHKHPLFLALDPEDYSRCQICKAEGFERKLNCMECDDYKVCFSCLTLPYKARYKHDSHFLMICDGKEASDQPDWCEVCEGKIKEVEEVMDTWNVREEGRYYKCSDCSTALHVECLLGKDIYMKPVIEDIFKLKGLRILLNNSLSRPTCSMCHRRCPFPTFYEDPDPRLMSFPTRVIYCSWFCSRRWCLM